MMRLALFALALGLFSLLAPATQAAAPADATGTWSWTVERNGQSWDVTLKLKQEGDKLSGTMSGRQGSETAIEDAKVSGDEVSFRVVRTFNDRKMVQNFKGKVSGNEIKGTVEGERNGEKTSRDWTARRAG